MKKRIGSIVFYGLLCASLTACQGEEEADLGEINRCSTIENSIVNAGFWDVTVTCDEEYAYLSSDTYPDHDLMNGIIGTNEQVPVPALNYSAPIKLEPQFANLLTTIDAAVGVAVNGVPIYDYSAQGELDIYNYDPNGDTVELGQLDNCGGHAGRGDDYHYHAEPTCMINSMTNANTNTIIGWAYDGYPLYGDSNPDGTAINGGDLDVCNGQLDDTFGYRYHTSAQAPYIIQCLVGEVDTSILPRVSPLSGDTNGIRANLTPPSGGVEDLLFETDADGTRTMSYFHNNSLYYVTYHPSSNQNDCYEFEQKTVSNGGIVESGIFCREAQSSSETPLPFVQTNLDITQIQTFGKALDDQISLGDGNNIDNYFRNSGIVIDEADNAYFAVNGVHPVTQGQYDSYYPKSIVKASLDDDTIMASYSFSKINGRDIDMEGLTFTDNKNNLYIGDEYNYIYELNLSSGAITREWDLSNIGISTSVDKGIEALTYSTSTGYFYAGIQESQKILTLDLHLESEQTLEQIKELMLPAGWAPSGLFAHKDGSLYAVSMTGNGTAGNQKIYRYLSDGSLQCELTIPSDLGIIRPDGIFLDANDNYLYIADSQGPIYGGASVYKIVWTNPCN